MWKDVWQVPKTIRGEEPEMKGVCNRARMGMTSDCPVLHLTKSFPDCFSGLAALIEVED